MTDESTMEIAEMVLGRVNKSLVQLVESLGVRAIASAARTAVFCGYIKNIQTDRISGYVGESNTSTRRSSSICWMKDFLPIVCPVGMDDDYNTYNINADDAACAIARAVRAEKLAFLTDIEASIKIRMIPSTLISELWVDDAKELMASGSIGGGMLPKLRTVSMPSPMAYPRGAYSGRPDSHCLLLEIFTNKGIGTAILNSKESRYYYGEQ